MAGATRTTADAALKEDYQPAIREQINNDIWYLQQLETDTKNVEGKRAILSLHVTRNSGVGARRELGALPSAGSQGFQEERVPLFYNYGRLQVSGPLMRSMKSDRGSFERAVDGETKRLVKDVKRDVNRQLFGTSNGVIATCDTSSTGQTVVSLASTTTVVQIRQFEVGMKVDIGTVAEAVAGTGGATYANAITAIDRTAGAMTITLTSNLSTGVTASTDFVFRAGSAGATTDQQEVTGLQTIVDSTGTVFNVNPTSVPTWASTENSNSGTNRQLTDTLVETVVDDIHLDGDGDPDLLITSHGVRRSYANQLKSQKRFANTTELKGGWKALEIDVGDTTLALMADRDCPLNTAFLLDTDKIKQYQMSDWEFMEEDGHVLFRVSGYDAYEATLFKYHEQATDERNAHGKIVDLSVA